MNCPSCNATNSDSAQWCSQCLTPIAAAGPVSQAQWAEGSSPPADQASALTPPTLAQQPSNSYPGSGSSTPAALGSPQASGSGSSNKKIALIGAAIAVVLVGTGGFFLLGGDSAKTYTDRAMDFKVTSFKCGEKSRSVIEGQQGSVAHPRNLVAKGQFCTMQLDIKSNLTSIEVETFSAANQRLLNSSGDPIEAHSVVIETITRPNNYYQPGPDPSIEPKKVVEAKVVWDYPVESGPTAAMLHASPESSGVRVPLA